jgi:hypothetical protein
VFGQPEGFITAAQMIIRHLFTVSESIAMIWHLIDDPPVLLRGSYLELALQRPSETLEES